MDKITTRKEANGYAFEVIRNGRVFVQGWSRGTKRDAIDEALSSAASREQRLRELDCYDE